MNARVIQLTVYGIAQPKGSTRAFMRPGMRVPIVTSDNTKLKPWAQLVRDAASVEMRRLGGVMLDGPVVLDIAFSLPRPVSLPQRVTAHTKKPDIDKLVRGCADALSGVVYRDDACVVSLFARKDYCCNGIAPHAIITIGEPAWPRRPTDTAKDSTKDTTCAS